MSREELIQKILGRAQEALNTSPHYPSVLSNALEDIIELCQQFPPNSYRHVNTHASLDEGVERARTRRYYRPEVHE